MKNSMTNELKEAFKQNLDSKGLLPALIELMKADSKIADEIHMAAQPFTQSNKELSEPLKRLQEAVNDMPLNEDSFAFVIAKENNGIMAMVKGHLPDVAVGIAKTMDREERIKEVLRMSNTMNTIANELEGILENKLSMSGNPLEDLLKGNPFGGRFRSN